MSAMEVKQVKRRGLIINLILIAVVIGLAVLPFFTARHAEFAGSDDQARKAIAVIKSDYKPWFSPVWKPPSGEVASLFFALQAAIGAGIVGYGLGYLRGRKKQTDQNHDH